MSELQNVELPNGKIAYDVPKELSKVQVLDLLAQRDEITSEQSASWAQGTPTADDVNNTPMADQLEKQAAINLPASMSQEGLPAGNPETYDGMGTAIAGNMDIPGGIAGSIAGAKAGTPFGPWGVLVGTVAGGAAGTFGGEVLSDYFMSENPDFSEATKSAAIGAGIEVATLGAASKFKTAMKLMGFDGNEIAQLWKTYTTKKPKAGDLQPHTAGSPESLLQTQDILEEGGGTLRAYQTGQESVLQRATEGIGEVGAISGPMIYQNIDQVNARTIAERLQGIADEAVVNPSGLQLGNVVQGVIDGGKAAARESYDKGITEVSKRAGKKTVNPKWFVGQIDNFLNQGRRGTNEANFSDWDAGALQIAGEYRDLFSRMPSMSVDDMLAFQRKLNKQIDQKGKFGSTPADQAAARDLAILSDKLRTTTEALLKNTDKVAHAKYVALNKAYGEAMGGLVPKINVNTITNANKGDYESIARVLEGKNPDQIDAFLKSIDTAFNQAKIAGIDLAETTGVSSAKQAKEIIKSGWLKHTLGEISPQGFDPKALAKKAAFFEKPANQRAARMILGDDWGTFKALLNAMSDSTTNPKGFLGSLVLRSKEAGAAGNVASGVTQGGIGGVFGGMAGLAAVLMTPVMLGKMVTRPAVVRALLEGNKKAHAASVAGKTALATEITEQTVGAIMDMFPPEEQAEIRNALRNP